MSIKESTDQNLKYVNFETDTLEHLQKNPFLFENSHTERTIKLLFRTNQYTKKLTYFSCTQKVNDYTRE